MKSTSSNTADVTGRRRLCGASICMAALVTIAAGTADAADAGEVRYFGRRPAATQQGMIDLGTQPGSDRLSVEFTNVYAGEIADYIARVGNCNVVLSDDIDDIISIRFLADTVGEALKKLANVLGASLRRETLNTFRLVKLPRVTLQFDDADLRTVIKQIAKLADGNVVLSDNVVGTVSLRVENATWRAALDNVVRTAGFQIVEEEGDILRIVTPEDLRKQRKTRVYHLHYIQPPPTYRPTIDTEFASGGPEDDESTRAFSGRGGAKGGSVTTGGDEAQFPLLNAVDGILSAVGAVQYDVFSNSLIVTDIPPRLEKVAEVVLLVDVRPQQVFIDVKFISTANTDLLDFGANYQNIDGNPNLGFSIDINGGSFQTLFPFTRSRGGIEDWIGVMDDDEPLDRSFPDAADPGGLYTFGNLRFNQFLTIMTFLKQDVDTVVVQAPKILTLDNSEATIFVGRTIRFAETFSTSNQAGGVEVGIREADASPVDTGFQLLVIPHIVRGTDDIILELIPEDEALTGTGTTIPGFDDFAAGPSSIQLPRISSRTVVTKLRMTSGHTAVLGGLIDERESETIRKLPFFGDIPALGWAFKSRVLQKNKSNLIMFVTCFIVGNDRDAERIHTVHRRYEGGTISDLERLFREETFEKAFEGPGSASGEVAEEDAEAM